MTLIYVSPFLGGGADYLALLHPALTPPVSWMGGKRRLAPAILALLGLTPGRPIPAVLGDCCWWGQVWPLILDRGTGSQISAHLRRWAREEPDPRKLWFILRDRGPAEEAAEWAAQLLWLQARAASGVPVWWAQEGLKHHVGQREAMASQRGLVSMDGHGRGPYPAHARTSLSGPGRYSPKGLSHGRTGGIQSPATVADRLDRLREVYPRSPPATVEHLDAVTLTHRWAPQIGARGRVYLDPPYQGCTGYPAACPRAQVLEIAERWARVGSVVVLSEAVPLAADLGSGWTSYQLQGTRNPEWVTCCREVRPTPERQIGLWESA